ncbi:hypothetical protein EMIHUDRAFT_222063 [Emiliania huxleyi CCMP1516]|uniref:Multidrug and toxic compound extrusion protein n=2 Tax=Emiliania huxleyi TaxID=2903 RepID=A0A0D3KZ33_EMIH1|nr:hypothetical protein EMIHUDRAFT_222063 [Emiliania huxleyi CCMP1516]EOD41018.1 hypothetical protein EMIHUDRAFT_222063 [Emiliania huxleyi CCMP1516]|eukprot:XP_005793447.1 hypothetical protein EMIHUDRAFT_222063 [Emiliania huxleyi CCMP1516]
MLSTKSSGEPLLGGRPYFSRRAEVVAMASMGWPMLVSFACRLGMGSTDSAFVGHITDGAFAPHEYLAAASLSDMVVNIAAAPPLAFNQVLNALVSQAIGADNPMMAGRWLQLSIIALAVGMLPSLICFFYVGPVLKLLGFSDAVCLLAGHYAKFNVFWPIPNGWYQCMRFYFQAMGITKPAMYNNLFFFFVNILLNWFFVFGGPASLRAVTGFGGFGFVGAAMSISMSRCLQPLAFFLYMFVYRKAHLETWPGWSMESIDQKYVKVFLAQALPLVGTIIFQMLVDQSSTLMISQLGTLAVACSSATQALINIVAGGASNMLIGVAAVRVGFHLGRGDGPAAARAAAMAVAAGVIIVGGSMLAVAPVRHAAMSTISSDPYVVEVASRMIVPGFLASMGQLLVGVGTGGVFAAQGRTILNTILAFAFELPCSIGSVFVLVMIMHTGVETVYWGKAGIAIVEAAVVMSIVAMSDWDASAAFAMELQAKKADSSFKSMQSSMSRLSRVSPGTMLTTPRVTQGADARRSQFAE